MMKMEIASFALAAVASFVLGCSSDDDKNEKRPVHCCAIEKFCARAPAEGCQCGGGDWKSISASNNAAACDDLWAKGNWSCGAVQSSQLIQECSQ
jgi:hypothetical protein